MLLPDVHLELDDRRGRCSPRPGGPRYPAAARRRRGPTRPATPPPAICSIWAAGTARSPWSWRPRARRDGMGGGVNERALDLCARNAAQAGLANVRVRHARRPGLPASYAGIWSNPPIRIGKQALHDLLGGWLPRLAPGAAATAVVQRHLGADSLHRWLTGQGWDVQRIASRAGYRVLRITRPAARSDPGSDPDDRSYRPTARTVPASFARPTSSGSTGPGGAAPRHGSRCCWIRSRSRSTSARSSARPRRSGWSTSGCAGTPRRWTIPRCARPRSARNGSCPPSASRRPPRPPRPRPPRGCG